MIQAPRIELLIHERDCFRSHFRKCLFVCLFRLNEFSHDIICILNKISKRFRFRSLGLEQYETKGSCKLRVDAGGEDRRH